MSPIFVALLALLASTFQTRAAQQAEIAALRHQIAVLQRSPPRRLRLKQSDRLLWILLSRWRDWRHWVYIVKPDTVVRWHRKAFAKYWTWKSRRRPGRPAVAGAIRDLIQRMSLANVLWGAPRIHGELLKLGIEVAPSTVGKYLRRNRRPPPSQSWRPFLKNHMTQMASMDFFTVATALFRVLFVFVVLSHDRRRVVHFNVTEHPTEAWTAQQLREAFPWDEAPRYLVRDRDAIFGKEVMAIAKGMGIEEVVTAAQSPWQNPYVERLIGSIRRECLNHVIVWNERGLRRTLRSYLHYYGRSRTHLALSKDAPEPRAVDRPENGLIVEIPKVGGLHHRYERRAA
jgi:hypothetical protein